MRQYLTLVRQADGFCYVLMFMADSFHHAWAQASDAKEATENVVMVMEMGAKREPEPITESEFQYMEGR